MGVLMWSYSLYRRDFFFSCDVVSSLLLCCGDVSFRGGGVGPPGKSHLLPLRRGWGGLRGSGRKEVVPRGEVRGNRGGKRDHGARFEAVPRREMGRCEKDI